MIVSIGEFKIKKLTLLPEFLKLSKKIYSQSKNSKGNISSELDNIGLKVFYSFTHWKTIEDMMGFVHKEHHAIALKETSTLCKEVSFLHYKTDIAVNLKTAKNELKSSEFTRVMKFE